MDGGDFCPTPTEPNKLKAQLIRELMDDMGYDVMGVGERELAFGQEYFLSLTEPTEMHVLNANLKHGTDEERVGDDYAILEVGGVKVGFLSLYFHQIRIGKKDQVADAGYVIGDAVEAANRILPRLREKTDIVVLLAHGPWKKVRDFIDEVSDFDFVVSAHDGGLDRSGREINETTLMKAGNRGQNIGKVTFVVDPEGNVELTSTESIAVKTSLPRDPDVVKKIGALNLKYNAMRRAESLAKQQGRTQKSDGNKYLGDATCRRCHEDVYQIWLETPHAAAYESLIEKERQADSDCVECHTTGHGDPTGFLPLSAEELKAAEAASSGEGAGAGHTGAPSVPGRFGPDLTNVQCEACHGIGTNHSRSEGAFRRVTESECARCHDKKNSPDFKYGDYLPHVSCSRLLEEAG